MSFSLQHNLSSSSSSSSSPLLFCCFFFFFLFSSFTLLPLANSASSQPPINHNNTRLLCNSKYRLSSNRTSTLQGNHYLRNPFLRSNLKEIQIGVPLSLSISVIDSDSCSPVENALVELWGSNHQGLYSGFQNTSSSPNSQNCSSWLRGALETDPDGLVKFDTFYPGPESGRALHLYAILRTDWFEHGKNHTVDSDSSHTAAAVGQIFFPDVLNAKVLARPEYKTDRTQVTQNQEDTVFAAGSGVWKADAKLIGSDLSGGLRAHVTISVNAHAPQGFVLADSPYQCKAESDDSKNNHTQDTSSTSGALRIIPSLASIAFFNLMMFYNWYQR